VFNFALLFAPWDAARWAALVEESERALAARGAWPVWVLSNHDQVRHRSRYGGSEARARVAAVVLLTLRGTPFLYAGEELGLEDASLSDDQRVDPGGRDGCRAPIPWAPDPLHGWPAPPWLPFPPEPGVRNAATEAGDPKSMLALYRRLVAARRASAALRHGDWVPWEAPPEVLIYERRTADDRRVVVANFGDARRAADLPGAGGWTVDVATDPGRDGCGWDGWIEAEAAVVLHMRGS
jgi:alpha-glucosidase